MRPVVVAQRVSRVAGKTPGGFGTGFNFPKGDPRASSLASLAIGSSGEEETENVTLCGYAQGRERKVRRERERERDAE